MQTRSSSSPTPSAKFRPVCPLTERAAARPSGSLPPISTFAPRPAPTVACGRAADIVAGKRAGRKTAFREYRPADDAALGRPDIETELADHAG